MLTFADNAWHVLTNVAMLFAGLSIAIGQKRFFKISRLRAVAMYVWHTLFCLYYFSYSLSNNADSTVYYVNSLIYDSGFNFGTRFVYYIASLFSQTFGMSYGGVFLLFNILGFIGMLAFGSALLEVTRNSSRFTKRIAVVVLFLPGLSFWSSAIGKDAITFMAAGLATWAILDLRRRALPLIVAALLLLFPRPHMAGILLASLACAVVLSNKAGFVKKIALVAVTLPCGVLAVNFGLEYAGLGSISGVGDIGSYFETRQGYNQVGGGAVDISSMSMPMRLFTYLFRPLLFDASGLLGLVASLENILLFFIIFVAAAKSITRKSVLTRFECVLLAMFSVTAWFVLANTTANLGISLRQKWMFLPMLLVLAFSYFYRQPKKLARKGR